MVRALKAVLLEYSLKGYAILFNKLNATCLTKQNTDFKQACCVIHSYKVMDGLSVFLFV